MKSLTTFEIFQFENRPPPVGAKTKMDFHVSLGFLDLAYLCIFKGRPKWKSKSIENNREHQLFEQAERSG